jgi:hypothetical protein
LWIPATSLSISLLPGIGQLGFASCLLLSPVFTLCAMADGRLLGQTSRVQKSGLLSLLRQGAWRVGILAALSQLAFAVSLLWSPHADWWYAQLFFVLGPLSSAALGWLAGLCCGRVIGRPGYSWLALAALLLGSLGHTAWRLYADPALFAYDPFLGHFSGNVYDLAVEVRPNYILYRLYNWIWASSILLFVAPQFTNRSSRGVTSILRRGTALALLTVALVMAGRTTELRFHNNSTYLQKVLNATHRSEHFVLHCAPNSRAAQRLQATLADHEFCWHLLEQQLGFTPPAPIVSYIFESAEQKRELLGAGGVEVAAPWRNHIYLQDGPFPLPSLLHELAHVFGAPLGDPIFRISARLPRVNGGLIEGFAIALAPEPVDHLGLHQQAAVLRKLENLPALTGLFGWSFWSLASARAYTATGSFCLWLLETRGVAKFRELYQSAGDFQAAYQEPIHVLEPKWLSFLEQQAVSIADLEWQRHRFQGRSVFERPHAYRATRLALKVRRLWKKQRLAEACELQSELAQLEPEIPLHQIYRAQLLAALDRTEPSCRLLDELLQRPDLTTVDRHLCLETLGDLRLVRGHPQEALPLYRRALELPLYNSDRRVLELKCLAAREDPVRSLLTRYLALFEPYADPQVLADRRLAQAATLRLNQDHVVLGNYLMARQQVELHRPEQAAAQLDQALSKDAMQTAAWPSKSFLREALRLRLSLAVQLGQFPRGWECLETLESLDSGVRGHQLRYRRWRQRLEFGQNRTPQLFESPPQNSRHSSGRTPPFEGPQSGVLAE